MVKLADQLWLERVFAPITYRASNIAKKLYDELLKLDKEDALKELDRLKQLSIGKLTEVFEEEYVWMADKPYDNILLPWHIVARRADDCDGTMVLGCAIRPKAKGYLICAFDNQLPIRFEKWHYIAHEPGYVFSNFGIYSTTNLKKWINKNYSWATCLAQVDWALSNPKKILLGFSAL